MLLLILACSPASSLLSLPELGPARERALAQLEDAPTAFWPEGDAFSARVPALGLVATFDAEGAWLASDGSVLGVRTAAWGRPDGTTPARLGPPGLDAAGARLSSADGDLTAWWASTPAGFQQGWTLFAPPAGDGPLALDVAIDGATPVVHDELAWLEGEDGAVWRVSGLAAWDADGRALPARLAPGPEGLRVVVDDEGARYPVVIDPIYTTAATTLTGSNGSHLGWSVASAGDVNGDGHVDVIVGAQNDDDAFVYYGSAEGVVSDSAIELSVEGADCYGWSVAGVGDVNKDGYDDVIVGAPYANDESGAAYVYYGSASGLSNTPNVTYEGEANAYLGYSVAGAGDVNKDGYADVIVGSNGYNGYSGLLVLYLGTKDGLPHKDPDGTFEGPGESYMGFSVAGAGDVNGDGYDDVIVGAPSWEDQKGAFFVYTGGASGLSGTPATSVYGTAFGGAFGFSVAGAGDVNKDGYDDVLVGESQAGEGAGAAYLYLGSASGVSSTAATTFTGQGDDALGYRVAGAGDVDKDGYDDVLLSAEGADSESGRVMLYTGSADGLSTTATTTLPGATGSTFGFSIAGAGDVNKDGFADVIIGAQNAEDRKGQAYVYLGYADAGGLGETEDTGGAKGGDGCGCATGGRTGALSGLALVLLVSTRRRASAPRTTLDR